MRSIKPIHGIKGLFHSTSRSRRSERLGRHKPFQFRPDSLALEDRTLLATTLWAEYFGGSNEDYGQAVAVDSSGDSAGASAATRRGGRSPRASKAAEATYMGPGNDAFLAKFDVGGQFLWGNISGWARSRARAVDSVGQRAGRRGRRRGDCPRASRIFALQLRRLQ